MRLKKQFNCCVLCCKCYKHLVCNAMLPILSSPNVGQEMNMSVHIFFYENNFALADHHSAQLSLPKTGEFLQSCIKAYLLYNSSCFKHFNLTNRSSKKVGNLYKPHQPYRTISKKLHVTAGIIKVIAHSNCSLLLWN